MSFQNNLTEILKKKKMTQKDFSKKVGLTERTMSYYACGRREPSLRHVKKIAKALHVSIDSLVK